MKIVFQIDPIETLNFNSDTSWQLMKEASKIAQVYYFTPDNLFWLNGKVLAKAHEIKIENDQYILDDLRNIQLEEVDIIFIRQDPPYDMNYLTSTYLLEKISDKVLIINNPKAIRDFPEKLSVLNFQDLTPPTLITSNILEAKNFANNYKKIILKPLYSYAGQDVYYFEANDPNFTNIFNNLQAKHKTALIVQNFIDKVTLGDKRIILVNGEPIGAYNRIPKEGDIRANAACGGKTTATILTNREIEICSRIKPLLVNNELFLAGIDIIDGYLTEINITSPTGVPVINKLYNRNLAAEILSKIMTIKKIKK